MKPEIHRSSKKERVNKSVGLKQGFKDNEKCKYESKEYQALTYFYRFAVS